LPTDSDDEDRSNLVIVAQELWLQKTLDLVVPTQGDKFAVQPDGHVRSGLEFELYAV
jgi:hypothetical protein